MAYNTLRMIDDRLAVRNVARAAVECSSGRHPAYTAQLGIDGVMIDMGHGVTSGIKQRVISTAGEINPDFAFWDENSRLPRPAVTRATML